MYTKKPLKWKWNIIISRWTKLETTCQEDWYWAKRNAIHTAVFCWPRYKMAKQTAAKKITKAVGKEFLHQDLYIAQTGRHCMCALGQIRRAERPLGKHRGCKIVHTIPFVRARTCSRLNSERGPFVRRFNGTLHQKQSTRSTKGLARPFVLSTQWQF